MNPSRLRISLLVLAALGGIALGSTSLLGVPGGLALVACFNDAGGLERGNPVMIGGIAVGRVSSIELDANFRACARLRVDAALPLAADTSAAIHTLNVLGDKYVALEPGGAAERLRSGDEIPFTQDALVVERLVGRLLMSLGVDD